MKWLGGLWRRGPALDAAQRAALAAYRVLPRLDLDLPSSLDRIVVVDVETSGLDPYRDRLISIGAVAVSHRLVRFDEGFEVVLEQPRPSDPGNILVHGIGGSAQLAGRDPAAGLLDFLSFAGRSPLAGFNADFDRAAIGRATSRVLGIEPNNVWLDLAVLLPALFPQQAAARTLDDWTGEFGIDNYARHDAVADALATAQLTLVALACAGRQGLESCADLISLEKDQRWLQR